MMQIVVDEWHAKDILYGDDKSLVVFILRFFVKMHFDEVNDHFPCSLICFFFSIDLLPVSLWLSVLFQ